MDRYHVMIKDDICNDVVHEILKMRAEKSDFGYTFVDGSEIDYWVLYNMEHYK